MLHALKTLCFQEVLNAVGYQRLQLYFAHIECTDWCRVSLAQSSRSSTHDWSPGQRGGAENYMWIDFVTGMAVEGSCAKRCSAKVFGFGSEATNEGFGSETQPRIRRRRGDQESVSTGSHTVKFAKNVTVIDDIKNEVVDLISAAFKRTADVEVKDVGVTVRASGLVQVGGYTITERDPRGGD